MFNRKSLYSLVVICSSVCLSAPALADTFPVFSNTMLTAGLHALHDFRCVKKCVISTTEIKPSGPPPIWHVRGGSSFPQRSREAETALLDKLYAQHVQGTIIRTYINYSQ